MNIVEGDLGIIRLEIRRAEDGIIVQTEALAYGLFKDRIDFTFIDDPDFGMEPYVTFEFQLRSLHDMSHEGESEAASRSVNEGGSI